MNNLEALGLHCEVCGGHEGLGFCRGIVLCGGCRPLRFWRWLHGQELAGQRLVGGPEDGLEREACRARDSDLGLGK